MTCLLGSQLTILNSQELECILFSHLPPATLSLSNFFLTWIFIFFLLAYSCFTTLCIYDFFPFIFISWRLITLQYCSGFCHTWTWISHGFTCIPHPDPPSLKCLLNEQINKWIICIISPTCILGRNLTIGDFELRLVLVFFFDRRQWGIKENPVGLESECLVYYHNSETYQLLDMKPVSLGFWFVSLLLPTRPPQSVQNDSLIMTSGWFWLSAETLLELLSEVLLPTRVLGLNQFKLSEARQEIQAKLS